MSPTIQLPFPRHLEEKTRFNARFQAHPQVKRMYPAFQKRHEMAEAAWEKGRLESEVSFKGFNSSFLLFEGER